MSFKLSILEDICLNQAKVDQFICSQSLSQLVFCAFQLALDFARRLVELELERRSEHPTEWPQCPHCGNSFESKGFQPRSMFTLIGMVHWRRRVGRCSHGCQVAQQVPLDQALGIVAHQETMPDLKEMACLLAIFMPYRISARIFKKLLGLHIGNTTIWEWVQQYGKTAMSELENEIETYQKGEMVNPEDIPPSVLKLKCLMGADGVFAPFRPDGGNPHGKIVWKEIKIGVITRLKERLNGKGEPVSQLVQRRLVAVLGDASMLAQRLLLESHKQSIDQASTVIWISDGGRWLWRIYQTYFASSVLGVLDFYHSAQNLWKGAAAWMDGRTKKAKHWFVSARHRLRHGNPKSVLDDFQEAINQGLNKDQEVIVINAKNYLTTHLKHIQYEQFKQQNIPIGSGFVESACKWLIQQRFKCVGMRWSEQGFSHLLHLRLLWVNERWEPLFQDSPIE